MTGQGAAPGLPFTTFPTEFGRYRIERVLGSGTMGVVYLATDLPLERKVAIKIPKVAASGALLKRMDREARTLAQLDHPNICKVYDFDEREGIRYMTLEYVEGETLKSLLQRLGRRRKPTEAVAMILQLARALGVAHEKGVVHRDLKPENVMRRGDRRLVIMDFGLNRQSRLGEGEDAAHKTQDGTVLGTPAYMSPEQAAGRLNEVDQRSDLYALGVMLYEMLTGELPFTGTALEIMGRKTLQEAPSPQVIVPRLPDGLTTICRKLLARKSEERYATCADLVRDLKIVDLTPKPAVDAEAAAEAPLQSVDGNPFDFLREADEKRPAANVPSATPITHSTRAEDRPRSWPSARTIAIGAVPLAAGALAILAAVANFGPFRTDSVGTVSPSSAAGTSAASSPANASAAEAAAPRAVPRYAEENVRTLQVLTALRWPADAELLSRLRTLLAASRPSQGKTFFETLDQAIQTAEALPHEGTGEIREVVISALGALRQGAWDLRPILRSLPDFDASTVLYDFELPGESERSFIDLLALGPAGSPGSQVPTPESRNAELFLQLEEAKQAYVRSRRAARDALLEDFEAAIQAARPGPSGGDENLWQLLEQDRLAYLATGRLSFAKPMLKSVRLFVGEVKTAKERVIRDYDKAFQAFEQEPGKLAAALDQEKTRIIEPHMIAIWTYTWLPGRTATVRFADDGIANDGGTPSLSWHLDDQLQCVYSSGGWTDKLTFAEDGRSMQGKNSFGHHKSAIRTDQGVALVPGGRGDDELR